MEDFNKELLDEEKFDICPDCNGTGYESCDEDDGEGHVLAGVGTRKCTNPNFHSREEEEYDQDR